MYKIIISIVIPSLETGGAESMAYQLAKALDKKKFNINFVCLSSKKGSVFEQELFDSGIDITYLNKETGLSISTFFKIWRKLNKHNTHIVHTHLGACLYVFPWVLLHKRKLVHTIHNIPIKELPLVHRIILKIMYKIQKAIPIAISDTIRDQTSLFYNLSRDNVPVIYNPVNIDIFKKIESKKNNEHITFVCVARLTHQKNHKMLLEAFSLVNKKLPNTMLLLAGDGELKEELIIESEHLKISENVKFLGNTKNIADLLNKSDVFVLSSIYEGLPMTILEAMGAKLPVIATRVGGVPDVVKNNGILVESGDVEGLANAMVKLVEVRSLRESMGALGFNMSKSYSITKISKQYEDVYQKYSIGVRKKK